MYSLMVFFGLLCIKKGMKKRGYFDPIGVIGGIFPTIIWILER